MQIWDRRVKLSRRSLTDASYAEFTRQKPRRNWKAIGWRCASAASAGDGDAYGGADATGGAVDAENLRRRHELLLRAATCARAHQLERAAESGDRVHRAVRLRKINVPAIAQPHERHHSRHASRRVRAD